MDHDQIVNKRARRIAKDHGCSVEDVHRALDKHPIELNRDTFLKRTLAMELVELDDIQVAFREKALVDRDTAAGMLLIKVAERRATLLGLNPPIGHAVQVVQHASAEALTSTDRIRAAIDRIRSEHGKPDSEGRSRAAHAALRRFSPEFSWRFS